jgi:hypothetical protein
MGDCPEAVMEMHNRSVIDKIHECEHFFNMLLIRLRVLISRVVFGHDLIWATGQQGSRISRLQQSLFENLKDISYAEFFRMSSFMLSNMVYFEPLTTEQQPPRTSQGGCWRYID